MAHTVEALSKAELSIPEGMEHYLKENDWNKVSYHDKENSNEKKIDIVIRDAKTLIDTCKDHESFQKDEDFLLLIRAFEEQTIEENGAFRLKKNKTEGLNSHTLQTPADPDATFREKAGEQHQGYVLNVVEAGSGKNSLIMDYQYEENTYADQTFMADYLEAQEPSEEKVDITTNGAYFSEENKEKAVEKNI